MVLEGVVTNVANFGAFVDIGVHQDGLVHISALSHKFVKDPREVVKAGDIVKVKVLEVDTKRRRIALVDEARCAGAARAAQGGQRDAGSPTGRRAAPTAPRDGRASNRSRSEPARQDGALAEALQRALQSR